MFYKCFNMKEDYPTVSVALANLEIEINRCKLEGIKVLKVIHGYGSSGVGGEIKKNLQQWLRVNKKKKFIVDYVAGELWQTSKSAQKIKTICPEVLGDSDLYFINPGITIILI